MEIYLAMIIGLLLAILLALCGIMYFLSKSSIDQWEILKIRKKE